MLDKLVILVICITLSSILMSIYLAYVCISNNLYNDIYRYITNTTYSSNVIRPIRRNMHITTYNQPKKEIELIPIKKYVVIQSPDQQFSIGVEVEPLSI
tara:strand:+ start:693 stop:989 length:297 start_codon:yes stop_codon:yes gene_type:complete